MPKNGRVLTAAAGRILKAEDFVHGVTDEPLVDRLLANIDIAMTPRWQQFSRLLMWEALDGGADSAPYPDGTVPGDLLAFRAAQEKGEVDEEFGPYLLTYAPTGTPAGGV